MLCTKANPLQMDNLTHSLVGAVLAQTGLKKKTGLAMPALVIGANIPDVDAACFFWLEGNEHLGFRRGITHGPPAMVLLPLVLAVALWWFDRWQTKRGKRPEGRAPVNFKLLYLLSLIGCLSHPALDWLNVYGVRFLEPFSSQWFYGDTLFIIDVWLWALLIGTLWWSFRRERRGGEWRKPAWIGSAIGLTYIGLNGGITLHAEHHGHVLVEQVYEIEPTEVAGSPVPFAFWEREILFRYEGTEEQGGGALYGSGDYDIASGPGVYSPRGRVGGGERITIENSDQVLGWHKLSAYSGGNMAAVRAQAETDSQIEAFLSWSRMPILLLNYCGDPYLMRDQRFTDPRAIDRFTVEISEPDCPYLNEE